MKRRQLLLAALVTLATNDVRALQSSAIARIGLLWVSSDGSPKYVAALREGLRAEGYEDGKNIQLDDRYLVKRNEDLAAAAAKLVAARVDVIFTWGNNALISASRATSTIPIVFSTAVDPVRGGVVESLAKPGRNATGISSMGLDLSGKRLEILKQVIPGIRHVTVLSSGDEGGPHAMSESIRQNTGPAAALGLKVRFVDIARQEEIEAVIGGLRRSPVDALVISAILLLAYHKRVVAAISKARLPAIYGNSDYVDAGGFMSLGPNQRMNLRNTAPYIRRILKGERPADLPIEQSSTQELVVNLKAARSLGITIPQEWLVRADRIIE